MSITGGEYNETIFGDIKNLSTRLESIEKVVNSETIVLPDGSEYSAGDFGYADTSIDVYVQDDPPTGLNTSTDVGDRWYDSNNGNALYSWDGYNWISISTGTVYYGGYGLESLGPAIVSRLLTSFTVYIQGTAPGSPTHGTIWKDTSSGNAIKYWDSTGGGQWRTVADQNTIDAVNNALLNPYGDFSDNQMTVFYQAAAPGGRNSTTHKGDKWYDTDDSYREHYWDGNVWVVGDGSGTVAGQTDGNPPSVSPTVTVESGIGSLQLKWSAVTNNDPIWYNVYVSDTTPVVKNSTTFVGVVYGTFTVVTHLGDGTPLAPGTTYYAMLLALDADGAAPTDGIEDSGQIAVIDLANFAQSVQDDINDIDTIRTTADGKNTNYYQAAEPTGGTYSVDDIWFDTDDGYKPYRWTGSAWVAYQFGTSALAANSVTTAILNAGAVTADKIAANSITADALVIGTLGNNKVLNPSFEGGRASDDDPNGWYWGEGDSSTYFDRFSTASAHSGDYVLRILDGPSHHTGVACKAFPVAPGEVYSVRYYVQGTATSGAHGSLINYSANLPSSGYVGIFDRTGFAIMQATTNATTTWSLVETTWTVPAGAYWASIVLISDSATGETIYYDSVDIREQAQGVMIADGAISADKIGVGAVYTESIQSGAILTDQINSNAAWIGTMSVDQLTAGILDADMVVSGTLSTRTNGTGQGFDITASGLFAYDDTNEAVVSIPSDVDANNPAVFKGNLETGALLVNGGLTMRGSNELSRQAVITIANSTTTSTTAPTLSATHLTVTISGYSTSGKVSRSMWWRSDLSLWEILYSWTESGSTPYKGEIIRVNSSGVYQSQATFISTSIGDVHRAAYMAGHYYFLIQTSTNKKWKLIQDNTTTNSNFVFFDTNSLPAMGVNAAGDRIILTNWTLNSTIQLYHYSSNCAFQGLVTLTGYSENHGTLNSILNGSFDFGSSKWIISPTASGTTDNYVWTSGLARESNNDWPKGGGVLDWDGSNFWSLSGNILYKHESFKWTTDPDKWWCGFTWYDSNATGGTHETALSTKTSINMIKRGRLYVTLPATPPPSSPPSTDDVTGARVYLGRSSSTPSNSIMYLQSQGTTITSPTFSGTNPPSSNNFPNATPGSIISTALNSDGNSAIYFGGDGTARLEKVLIRSTTDATNTTGNVPALRIGNPSGTHLRIDDNEIIAMSSDTAQTTLYLNAGGHTRVADTSSGTFQIGGSGTTITVLRMGYTTITTNSSGEDTISHGLGLSPNAILATIQNSNQRAVNVFSYNSSTFSVRIVNHDTGTPVGSGASHNITWIAYA